MFQFAKRSLITALLVTAIAIPLAACSIAYARINLDTQAPAVSVQESSTDVPQYGGVQASSHGFDWADAGIGAAVTVVLIGAGMAMRSPRRRVAIGRDQRARQATTS
jgi:hypothetical protein